jgi:hypothetical protein
MFGLNKKLKQKSNTAIAKRDETKKPLENTASKKAIPDLICKVIYGGF